MSGQRARSAVAAGDRSIHPRLAGVPWWAAILIATTATAIGFAFDAGSGNKELTHVFAGLYVLGCAAAVLMVQQSGVFTAVIQPPLILFCAVPGAYWLFHGATFPGLKNLLINCGYPLIERFPLMLFTSAGVLLIGMVRWYLGMTSRLSATAAASGGDTGGPGLLDRIATKLASIWDRRSAASDDAGDQAPVRASRRRRPTERPARATRDPRAARATKRSAATRSRPVDDAAEAVERPRRRRPEYLRGEDFPPPPRRRPREPRDPRRDPRLRDGGPPRRRRTDSYPPVEPPEPPRHRQPAAKATNGADSTHHPISRVRYRGASDQPRTPRPRKSEPETWEYDI